MKYIGSGIAICVALFIMTLAIPRIGAGTAALSMAEIRTLDKERADLSVDDRLNLIAYHENILSWTDTSSSHFEIARHYMRLINLDPENAEKWTGLADLALDEALRHGPFNGRIWLRKYTIDTKMRESPRLAILQQAIKLAPYETNLAPYLLYHAFQRLDDFSQREQAFLNELVFWTLENNRLGLVKAASHSPTVFGKIVIALSKDREKVKIFFTEYNRYRPATR